jgi:hypothetical protein
MIDPCFLSVDSIAVGGNRSGTEPAIRAVVKFQGDFQMRGISAIAAIVAIAILAGSASSFAQGTGGRAGNRAGVGGTAASGPQTGGDAAIDAEDKAIDRKLTSICRGC